MKDLFGVRHETLSTMMGRHIVGADRVDRDGNAYAGEAWVGNVFTPVDQRKRLPGEIPSNDVSMAANTIMIFFVAVIGVVLLMVALGRLL